MKSYRTEPFQNIGLLVYVFDDQELCTMYFCTFNGTFIVTCKMYHLRYDSYVRWPWIIMETNIFSGHQMFGYVYHIWITYDISYMIYNIDMNIDSMMVRAGDGSSSCFLRASLIITDHIISPIMDHWTLVNPKVKSWSFSCFLLASLTLSWAKLGMMMIIREQKTCYFNFCQGVFQGCPLY